MRFSDQWAINFRKMENNSLPGNTNNNQPLLTSLSPKSRIIKIETRRSILGSVCLTKISHRAKRDLREICEHSFIVKSWVVGGDGTCDYCD